MYDGEQLNLTRITRSEMGAYLCIATNGVPPTVSKRITVDVECEFVTNTPRTLLSRLHVTNMGDTYASIERMARCQQYDGCNVTR